MSKTKSKLNREKKEFYNKKTFQHREKNIKIKWKRFCEKVNISSFTSNKLVDQFNLYFFKGKKISIEIHNILVNLVALLYVILHFII